MYRERQPVEELDISWRHTIEGDGFKSEGLYECESDLESAAVPADLTGKSVLDIGCSDGGHSFLCERRGATVTGIDSQESPRNEGRNGFTYAREQRDYRIAEIVELESSADRVSTARLADRR